FISDPHVVHTALPMGFLTALKEGTGQVQANLAHVTVPALILQGTRDNLVPVSSSEFTRDNIASQDKTLKIYPGLSHATLHDTGHEAVWSDVLQWLDEHSQQH
ncbi:MAG TPA: alpha/beta hydrolase, partial [Pseudomonadales bacterium]|nr:alpha/beta hydrolase [Pseudomonadales bacterium]